MKRMLHISALLITSIGVAKQANCQDVYWRESFTNAATVTSDPGANSVPYLYAGDAGSWLFYGLWTTTGTDCPALGEGNGTNRHIRSTNNTTLGDGTPAIVEDDTTYAITPMVSNGVQEVHLYRSRSNRRITVWKTSDEDVNTTNWVLATVIPKSTLTSTCSDTALIINDANAKRIRFRFERGTNTDIDSVYLTSVTPLPVKYTSFSGMETSGKVKLSWNIATELNVTKYVVERSANGREFNDAGAVAATQSASYTWLDQSPIAGTNYYRVKSVDRDGAVLYTGVVKVTLGKTARDFVVSPNPVRGRTLNLQFNGFEKGRYSVVLFNSVGQRVFSNTFDLSAGSSNKSLQLPTATQKGIYRLQLVSDGKVSTKSIVVE